MELSSIKYIDPAQIADYKADLFITALGFETRSTVVARKFERHPCRKIALEKRQTSKDFAYQENLRYFNEQGFEIIQVESELPDLDAIFQSLTAESVNLVIDFTNMSPLWYKGFFGWFHRDLGMEGKVRLRTAYTMASYVPKSGLRKIKKIYDFSQEEIKPSQSKKTALILGLGQEKKVSELIHKLINPDLVYLFYADPPADKGFVEKVFENNHKLINEVPIRNLISYPIRNGQEIYQSLINTILPLRNDHSIVLVPHGPKIFSVVSMLVHLGYPDIRISYPDFKKHIIADRLPKDEPVVLDILFEGEE